MDDKKPEERGEAAEEDSKAGEDTGTRASGTKESKPVAPPQADQVDDEEEDDEEEEEEAPPPPPKKQPAKATKKAAAKASAVVEAPKVIDPVAIRNGEVRTGLVVATFGYAAFWVAWMIYSKSVAAKQLNFFSHSAWLVMIAFVLVTIAAFYFVRIEVAARYPKAPAEPSGSKASKPTDVATTTAARVDRNGLLLAAAVCAPLYGVYWYMAKFALKAHYAQNWWAIEAGAFALITFGAWWGMRPPSLEDERRERMPTRRVLTLLTVPYLLVFGMIWLASVYPPWP